MNATHDEGHELVLASRLAGELAPDSPEVQRLLSACPTCRELLAELDEVSTRLGESAAEREADLAAAARLAPEPLEPRLQARLEELARVAPARSHRVWPWLCAAAALVVFGFLWRGLQREPEPPPPVILGDGLVLVEPRGPSDYGLFVWRYPERPSGGFLVSIFAEDAPADAPPLLKVPWNELSWKPDEATRRALPERIRWKVEARDDFGTEAVSQPASAWRSP